MRLQIEGGGTSNLVGRPAQKGVIGHLLFYQTCQFTKVPIEMESGTCYPIQYGE